MPGWTKAKAWPGFRSIARCNSRFVTWRRRNRRQQMQLRQSRPHRHPRRLRRCRLRRPFRPLPPAAVHRSRPQSKVRILKIGISQPQRQIRRMPSPAPSRLLVHRRRLQRPRPAGNRQSHLLPCRNKSRPGVPFRFPAKHRRNFSNESH